MLFELLSKCSFTGDDQKSNKKVNSILTILTAYHNHHKKFKF